MRALLGEAAEADEEFWGQDFFAEEGGDLEYEQSDSETSVYDSDFSEQEVDDEGEVSDEEEVDPDKKKKKKLLPPGRTRIPQKKKKVVRGEGQQAATKQVLIPGLIRKSSRASVVEASIRHEEHKRMQKVEQEIRKYKRESDSFKKAKAAEVTMHDLIRDCCLVVEKQNELSLNHLLEREEEAKRRNAAKNRNLYLGPKVKYHSYKGDDGLARNELVYLDGAVIPHTNGSTSTTRSNIPTPPKLKSLLKIKIKPPKKL